MMMTMMMMKVMRMMPQESLDALCHIHDIRRLVTFAYPNYQIGW